MATIKAKFRKSKAVRSRTYVLEYMERSAAELDSCGKFGTARNYRRAINSFSAFLGRDIPIERLNESVVAEYDEWLRRRNIVRNTVSFYMRVLRSIYNRAVKQCLVKQTFPFCNVYTGVDRTRKRAVDERVILRLQHLNLDSESPLALTRDLFVFSYCMRGMAFVDIAFLRKTDICGDVITYIRRKTGQNLVVRIEPCIERIIRRYEPFVADSPYVFPLIGSSVPETAFREYQIALGIYNRRLKELSQLAGIDTTLTSYVARHTWATVARNRNIPLSVISAGMGHASEKTTQIYLASLENTVIDRANRRILEALNQ